MSLASTSVAGTRAARYSLLIVELPGQEAVTAGVLLEDPASNLVHIRLRRDWDQFASEEAEVLSLLEDELLARSAQMGAAEFLAQLEDTLSNTVRVSERRETIVEDFPRALGRLYRQHVTAVAQPFFTHLPRYSLAVAAGPFLENHVIEEEGWEETPPNLRLTPEMFVARIAGRSMEPLIPDQSLCVFRRGVTGSRQGRLVLVEALDQGGSDRYTVKRYRSEKRQNDGGEWSHQRIRLEPLNPAFDAWDLDPQEDRYRILAEFVQILD
ncbi:MAG: S24 family peptidase [Acidobacteriota bacterium]|nr:S24 family peptidase [Acidobacteriota bacterium]